MALTKIGSIGINTGIAFAGVTTITTLNGSDAVLSVGGTVNFVSDVSIGGTVSIAGTLTYEDVTNVDAVGLITARDGIKVGSGITLSVDGDVFATGVVTATSFVGSGAELTGVASTENIRTNTNAAFLQNVSIVGTSTVTGNIVPSSDSATDIGTNSVRFQNAYVDNYYGDGTNLTNVGVDTAVVFTDKISLGDGGSTDGDQLCVGVGSDLKIYHANGNTSSYVSHENGSGYLFLEGDAIQLRTRSASNNDIYVNCSQGAQVELYHSDNKRLETTSYGTQIAGYQSSTSYVGFHVKGTNNDHGFGTDHGSGLTTYDVSYYSPIPMFSSKTIDYGSSYLSFPSYASGNYVKFTAPVSGLYQLELLASVEAHHGGDWFAFGWEINTTTVSDSGELMNNGRGTCTVYERAGGDEGAGSHFSTTIYMAENDYAILYQQSSNKIRWKGNQYYVRGHLIH